MKNPSFHKLLFIILLITARQCPKIVAPNQPNSNKTNKLAQKNELVGQEAFQGIQSSTIPKKETDFQTEYFSLVKTTQGKIIRNMALHDVVGTVVLKAIAFKKASIHPLAFGLTQRM